MQITKTDDWEQRLRQMQVQPVICDAATAAVVVVVGGGGVGVVGYIVALML